MNDGQTFRHGGLGIWTALAFGLPGIGFVVLGAIPPPQVVPIVLGLPLIAITAVTWRARVVADGEGLRVVNRFGTRQWRWDQVVDVSIVKTGG